MRFRFGKNVEQYLPGDQVIVADLADQGGIGLHLPALERQIEITRGHVFMGKSLAADRREPWDKKDMWRRSSLLFYLVLVAAPGPSTSFAQNLPGTPQSPTSQAQSPVTISPIQPSSAPTSGLPANVVTPSTTNQLEPSPGARSRSGTTFGTVGRGLPGMPGGPPLNGFMGAQDPTADYMRPPSVGPLFCDPAINLPC